VQTCCETHGGWPDSLIEGVNYRHNQVMFELKVTTADSHCHTVIRLQNCQTSGNSTTIGTQRQIEVVT
jgi:hypothetical protein